MLRCTWMLSSFYGRCGARMYWAWLDTFSFQACGFNEKLGYQVFSELHDNPPGHTRFFLKKFLSATA
jgi:hypothetical protein